MSVFPLASLEKCTPTFTRFFVQIACDHDSVLFIHGVAVRYVLPVLCMTLCIHTVRPMCPTSWSSDNYSALCLLELIRMRHRGRSLLCWFVIGIHWYHFVGYLTVLVQNQQNRQYNRR